MAGNGERWRGGGHGKGAKGQPARHERRPPADPPEASFHGTGAALDAFEPELFGTAASLLSLGDGQLRNHGTFLRQTDTRARHP